MRVAINYEALTNSRPNLHGDWNDRCQDILSGEPIETMQELVAVLSSAGEVVVYSTLDEFNRQKMFEWLSDHDFDVDDILLSAEQLKATAKILTLLEAQDFDIVIEGNVAVVESLREEGFFVLEVG